MYIFHRQSVFINNIILITLTIFLAMFMFHRLLNKPSYLNIHKIKYIYACHHKDEVKIMNPQFYNLKSFSLLEYTDLILKDYV